MKLSRRKMLKFTGGALGALVLGNPFRSFGKGAPEPKAGGDPTQQNSYFDSLPVFPLGEPLDPNEMRITFFGTSCIPRLAQECNSVFVETGSGDSFIFDCGSGVYAKYNAMGIIPSKMNKVFITHLHGDHTSDLIHLYCFGPSLDRHSPLFIWGPGNSDFTYTDPDNNKRGPYEDGTRAFCENFRDAMRWHTESFSFLSTGYDNYSNIKPTQASWGLPCPIQPVSDDGDEDGYSIIPIELNWRLFGQTPGDNIAYNNSATGVKITHFPAMHTRFGSVSYKLEWMGFSMIFSGDSLPNTHMIEQAAGVDVLIHEMVVPAETWAEKNSGLKPGDPDWQKAYDEALQAQNCSHTPQGAFGYMLSQMKPAPRLSVATHFQAEDDTIQSAMQSVRNHYPIGDIAFAMDFVVINVSREKITQRRAVVSDFAFMPKCTYYSDPKPPKYWLYDYSQTPPAKVSDPLVQIDTSTQIHWKDPITGHINFREDGY